MGFYSDSRKYKPLDGKIERKVSQAVRRLLHESRDCLRNTNRDTTKITFDVTDGYYAEAFGVMRGLSLMGHGDFGPDNYPHKVYDKWNLKWWFAQIAEKVLKEENFGGNNHCDYCVQKYGKDGAGRTRNDKEAKS
jgi:hypothetical protein